MLHRIDNVKNLSLFGTAVFIMLIGCMEEVNFTGIFIIGTTLVICLGVYLLCKRARRIYLDSRTTDKMTIKAPGRRKIA